MRKLKDRIHCDAQVHKPNAEREIQVLREIIERVLLLALHYKENEEISMWSADMRRRNEATATATDLLQYH